VGKLRLLRKDKCPLECGFRVSYEHHDLQKHLQTHELSDRSKGHAAILAAGLYPEFGPSTCPLCSDQTGSYGGLVHHLSFRHTKSERALSIMQLSGLLGPFVSQISFYGPYYNAGFLAEIDECLRQQQLSS
jgi:hypothetical protein